MFTKQPLWPLSYVGKTCQIISRSKDLYNLRVFFLGFESVFNLNRTPVRGSSGECYPTESKKLSTPTGTQPVVGYARPHNTLTTNWPGCRVLTTSEVVCTWWVSAPGFQAKRKESSVNLYDPYDKTQLDNINKFYQLIQAIFAMALFLVLVIGLFIIGG